MVYIHIPLLDRSGSMLCSPTSWAWAYCFSAMWGSRMPTPAQCSSLFWISSVCLSTPSDHVCASCWSASSDKSYWKRLYRRIASFHIRYTLLLLLLLLHECYWSMSSIYVFYQYLLSMSAYHPCLLLILSTYYYYYYYYYLLQGEYHRSHFAFHHEE